MPASAVGSLVYVSWYSLKIKGLYQYLGLEFSVLCLQLLDLLFVAVGAADSLLEVVDGVPGLLWLLVQGHEGLGQQLQHAGLLQVLLELLLLGVLGHLGAGHVDV